MSADKMPPLPEAYHASEWEHDMFTGDQMHAYARAYAAEQTRELVEALVVFVDFPADTFEGEEDVGFLMTVRLRDMRLARSLIAKHKEQA